MKIIVCKDYDAVSKKGASIVKDAISMYRKPKLGLATGSTPEGLYRELIAMNQSGELNFEHAETVNLDEYVGIDSSNEQSYHYYMYENLFNHINIRPEHIHIPLAEGDRLDKAVAHYNAELDYVGRRDIQILGMGHNGHIAFIEPSDKLSLRTCVVELTPETIVANSRFFASEDDVPRQAITMGIKDILNTDTLLIMATGEGKAPTVKRLIEGKRLNTHFPASMLHLHTNAILLVDEAAYSLVEDVHE